jgi:type IV pilus assembly protein PilB
VIDDIFDDSGSGDFALVQEKMVDDIADLEAAAEGSPVIKLVNYLIYNAVKEGASDVHIEPDDNSLRVRYRVDGSLYEKLRPPCKMLPAICSRIKIMAGLDIAERRLPQDGGIHVMMDSRPVDLRVSTIAGKHGEKIVIRIIDNRTVLVNLEKLGFSYEMLKEWRKLIALPNGIVLVTGPTGSGKSTTLYSVLRELNSDDVNICTVEDPVEFNMPWINQFQVNEKIGFTFSGALRSLLRQDPDIIMVGEIRDNETARIAVQAALTGHLVLSTLHTNDAPSSITRLINIGVEPYLISASVNAVVAQRLVRRICQSCKQPMTNPRETSLAYLRKYNAEKSALFQGAGCEKCRQTGYKGRLGVYELLVLNDDVRDLVTRNPGLTELRRMVRDMGMRTLRDDGLAKVADGQTTVDEIMRVTEI